MQVQSQRTKVIYNETCIRLLEFEVLLSEWIYLFLQFFQFLIFSKYHQFNHDHSRNYHINFI